MFSSECAASDSKKSKFIRKPEAGRFSMIIEILILGPLPI